MIHDRLGNWPVYFHTAPWRCVFEYLGSLSEASKESARVSLQGDDIYAIIMSYQTCAPEESVLEERL